MGRQTNYTSNERIDWYRCEIDKETLRSLTQRSDWRGFMQVIPQLSLSVATGALAYYSFLHWPWYITVLAVYLHGTFGGFLGMAGPGHELSHRTVFKSRWLNELFIRIYCFLTWSNFVSFRASHTKHHAVTVYKEFDGEVVLPRHLKWKDWLMAFTCNPMGPINAVRNTLKTALGRFEGEWTRALFPEEAADKRREVMSWARTMLIGHAALAAIFIATGHPFLILLVSFSWFCGGWMAFLVGYPQHAGMMPDVPDFRLSCRTFTCNPLSRFLYWNMNYHVEHHMYAAVPFYNLPKLRQAIEHDLPPANRGIIATWREILAIQKRQKEDPSYVFVPELPNASPAGSADTTTQTPEDAELASA